jgi:hypothetical protein
MSENCLPLMTPADEATSERELDVVFAPLGKRRLDFGKSGPRRGDGAIARRPCRIGLDAARPQGFDLRLADRLELGKPALFTEDGT